MQFQQTVSGLFILATLLLPAGRLPAAELYSIDASASKMEVIVGKEGLFARLGHVHNVVVQQLSGTVRVDSGNVSASGVELSIPAAGLRVEDAGVSEKDRSEVQEHMVAKECLSTVEFPTIRFTSELVQGPLPVKGTSQIVIHGRLELHGMVKQVDVPARVILEGDQLTAAGEVSIKQTDFGISPSRAGLGTVRTKDQLKIKFTLAARRGAPSPAGAGTAGGKDKR